MDLHFSPLACSMAIRIAFYEAGIAGNFVAVDTQAKKPIAHQALPQR
jgi:glutathione S-transferase